MIFSRTPTEHIAHVRRDLTVRNNAGVTLRLKKCLIFKGTFDYLGHIIRTMRLKIALDTTLTIYGIKAPMNLSEHFPFLGLCNVVRRFVPNFARLAAHLKKALNKHLSTFQTMNKEYLQSMQYLKYAVFFPHVLALPTSTGRFKLDAEGCAVQVGCALLQE